MLFVTYLAVYKLTLG